jgi:hypothetical protein
MDEMDNTIFKYLIFNDENSMLSKYRDYFPLCNNVPKAFDILLFSFIYIFYIPIVIIITIVNHNYNSSKSNLINLINFNIKHPLMLSNGMVYNGIIPYFFCMKLNTKLKNNTFNKLSWDSLFKDNGVPTPEIYATISDGKITGDVNKKAIIKPVHGCCGKDISLFNKTNIPNDQDYVVQEFIETGIENRSFRIITNCSKNDISLWDIYMLINNKITTNQSQGGFLYKFQQTEKRFINISNHIITLTKIEHNLLNKSIKYAKKCHKSLLFCPTIGWDVIINSSGIYFLEGNIGVSIKCKCDNILRDGDYIDFIKPIYNHIIY